MPELGVSGHLGGAGQLVGAGAQEVAALHVTQRPAPAVVVRHTATRFTVTDVWKIVVRKQVVFLKALKLIQTVY